MTFTFSVPSLTDQPYTIELEAGLSTYFVGANGSGKTRLAAQAESDWALQAHRISAHRALSLNPHIAKITEEKALAGLSCGWADALPEQRTHYRSASRWSHQAATVLLNDFDFLVQALFADQYNISLKTHEAAHAGTLGKPEETKLQKLSAMWDRVLPHRTLQISGDNIQAVAVGHPAYSAGQMSDGERAVFYLLGQVLVAAPNSVLIFDEPELHIHRAILSRLWDEAEAARSDCAFLVITHDLEFAASRPGQKFVIRRYQPPGVWEIEPVPEDTGFNEEITTLILGSRKPILFVEGTGSSLDLAIYRACYPDWTVVPRGGCENVIHAVATMRNNASLTWITCSGVVDADDYSEEDKTRLSELGVATLPVSEIENLFLLPNVAIAILEEERFQGAELQSKLDALKKSVLAEVNRPGSIDGVVLRYCRRRIDRTMKKIDLTEATTTEGLAQIFAEKTSALDIAEIAKGMRDRIEQAVASEDLTTLMANFDNKAFLTLAATHLKGASRGAFESWLSRTMRDPQATRLKAALAQVVPIATAG